MKRLLYVLTGVLCLFNGYIFANKELSELDLVNSRLYSEGGIAKNGISLFYAGYFSPKVKDNSFLPQHQGGVEFHSFHTRNLGTSTGISMTYLRSGTGIPLLAYEALSLDFSFLLDIRIPTGNLFAFTASLGWFIGFPVGIKDLETGRFGWGDLSSRQEVGKIQTGPVFKAGFEYGKQLGEAVFFPFGLIGRYHMYDGFKLGAYAGIGIRY